MVVGSRLYIWAFEREKEENAKEYTRLGTIIIIIIILKAYVTWNAKLEPFFLFFFVHSSNQLLSNISSLEARAIAREREREEREERGEHHLGPMHPVPLIFKVTRFVMLLPYTDRLLLLLLPLLLHTHHTLLLLSVFSYCTCLSVSNFVGSSRIFSQPAYVARRS